ncbi:hypothetical protein QWJ34_00630 [Saccharibacillus sp. CPCC 101409]|uniref:hypothetical protein n=1 Tax=Saccharibacillus sp. CPCC 101409 TaxID=3058041 RepID=UPI002670E045|nr:hypothetical protein [Saccharibacillus sp. CPCC 101409]MDO3408263.1 hypothetical protein [Saccharibacillus sp. CPCC 101409]
MSVDDYLDLYNYAKSINDAEWQNSLVDSMLRLAAAAPASEQDRTLAQLWERFDRINADLLNLFARVRLESRSAHQSGWIEQIWELKQERINVSQQIRGRYIRV